MGSPRSLHRGQLWVFYPLHKTVRCTESILVTTIEAMVLGIVEGLSEFLPISSTGHLILASALMKLKQSEAHKVFEVTIQSGAILAVVYIYRKQLASRIDLMKKVCFAFLPTGALGYLLYKLVKS